MTSFPQIAGRLSPSMCHQSKPCYLPLFSSAKAHSYPIFLPPFLSVILTLEYVLSQLVPSYISHRCLGFTFSSHSITIQSLHSFGQNTLSSLFFPSPTHTSYLKSFPSMPAGTTPPSCSFPQFLCFNSCNILQPNRLHVCLSTERQASLGKTAAYMFCRCSISTGQMDLKCGIFSLEEFKPISNLV